MPDRTRPIRKEICLNEQELSMVRHKMNQLGTRNFGAYARKMLVGMSPKPSSFTKGRNAYGKQNTTKSDTFLRLRR